jgi:hypothetical protein
LIGWNRKRKGKRLGKGGDFGAQELNVREGREGRVNRYNGRAAAAYVIETYDRGLEDPTTGDRAG